MRVPHSFKLALICLAAPTLAHAACAPNMTALVSCTAGGGAKTLDLCTDSRHVLYRYGNTGDTPDIELIRTVGQVGYTPWPGVGSAIWESVTLSNGDYLYEVHSTTSRDPGAPVISGGVEVVLHGKTLASITCDEGSTTTQIDALFAMREAAGLCYDQSKFAWNDCAQ